LFYAIFLTFGQLSIFSWIFILAAFIPMVSGSPIGQKFPDITFKTFNAFITANFDPLVSLSTVLMVLFTLTENSDLLNLHSRQQHVFYDSERKIKVTGWIKALTTAISDKLGDSIFELLLQSDLVLEPQENEYIQPVALKLNKFANILGLLPYTNSGRFMGKTNTISLDKIQPVTLICPQVFSCQTATCNPRSLLQSTKDRDIPRVTFIKGNDVLHNVQVLTGRCPTCKTTYSADHERFQTNETSTWNRVYINSAKHLKIGQSIWVDRTFSKAILNSVYSFHASVSAFAEYWNNTYGLVTSSHSTNITRRQVWHAFIQESLRTVADASDMELELNDALNIDEVTHDAFEILGKQGCIQAAHQHSCSECTQPYRFTSDVINDASSEHSSNMNVDSNASPVKLIVLDGIVMGPTVSYNYYIYI
jgi:hypothetical protein